MTRAVSHPTDFAAKSANHGVLANSEGAVVVVPRVSRRTLSFDVGPGRRVPALVVGAALGVLGALLMATPLAALAPWWPTALVAVLPDPDSFVAAGMLAT